MTAQQEYLGCLSSLRGSRKLVLVIVAIALLLDNLLLTTVVPIIPAYLYQIRHSEHNRSARDVETRAVPVNEIPQKATSTPLAHGVTHGVHLNQDAPYFLDKLKHPTKSPASHFNIPGFTFVPNEVFWSFTSTHVPLVSSASLSTPSPSSAQNGTVTASNGSSRTTSATQAETYRRQLRHQELLSENVEVGIMFASKPIVQAMTNPFIGPLSNRIGYSIPMFIGFVIVFISTLIFAIGTNYSTLFIARALQGVGSACTSVAGMGMLAESYTDDEERGNAMAFALGGLALGVLIGPPFGGAMYEFVGKSSPFLVLAALALIDGILQLFVLQPKIHKQTQEGTPLSTLIKDPYILVCAGAITFSNLGIAVLEPSLPLWMMDTMDASKWQQGAAFLPASISYLIGTNVFGPLGHRMGRWLAAMTGLIIIGVCLLCVPMAKSVDHLIPSNAGIGFAIGMVDSSMMPMLGYLVDIRHTSVYGSVYAIADVAFCLGFIIGPAFSASIVKRLGFDGLVYIVALISFLYAPLMFLLRKPPGRTEIKPVLRTNNSVKYSLYTDEDKYHDGEELKRLKDEEEGTDQTCY